MSLEFQLVDQLREKLEDANLSKEQLVKMVPPSLLKRHQHSLPAYKVNSYKKQKEEAFRRLNPQLPPSKPKIPIGQQQRYLQEFQDAKDSGKFAHLSEEVLKQLEDEVKSAVADADKAPHLQEFLKAAQQEGGEHEEWC